MCMMQVSAHIQHTDTHNQAIGNIEYNFKEMKSGLGK